MVSPLDIQPTGSPEGDLRDADVGIAANFARWLRFIGHEEGAPVELQVIEAPANYGTRSRFAHAATLADAVRLLDIAEKWSAPGVFAIINNVDPAVATRDTSGQWHDAKKGQSTTDHDIRSRAAVFIDIDAKRVRGTSATDEEVRQTADVGARVYGKLLALLGGEEPLGYGHSGNGRSVFIALEHIPESPELESTIKGILAALGCMFLVPRVEIDPVVSDAKRLGPAWGTTKRKGAAGVAERPHRRTVFVCSENVRRVSFDELRELLRNLRAELTTDPRRR